MDNIQKLILGVLGISGMLAMLVPSGAGVAPPPPVDTAALAAANPEATPTGDGVVPEEEVTDESETDEDVFLVGEPAIDGNPLQGTQPNYQTQQPAVPQYAPQPSFDYSQPAFVPEQSFATPQLPLPVPPPAN